MNKESIKRILQYTNEESIPLAILGIIEGIVECYQDGKYSTSFEPLADIENAIAALKELREIDEQRCADETRTTFEAFDRMFDIREPQLSDE